MHRHPPQEVRTRALGGGSGEANHFVAQDVTLGRHRPGLDDLVRRVVLQPGDEEHPVIGQPAKPLVVRVAAVDHHDGPGLEAEPVDDADIRPLAVGDDREARQVAVVI